MLFSFATANQVIAPAVASPLVVAVALSMVVTPLLMIVNEKLIQPLFSGKKESREADVIDEENPVIIAGFGRFGHIVGRLLRANGIGATVLDLDPEQIEVLRRFGLKVFYGDAGRLDLLHTAGAHQARLLLLAIDDEERANAIAAEVKRHFPNLTILARANSLHHAYDLLRKGADHVFRETMDSALEMGVEALRQLGFRAYQAHRAARIFKRHEHKTMDEVFALWDRDADHVEHVREHMSELDRMMQSDRTDFDDSRDHSWEAAAAADDTVGDNVSSADPAAGDGASDHKEEPKE